MRAGNRDGAGLTNVAEPSNCGTLAARPADRSPRSRCCARYWPPRSSSALRGPVTQISSTAMSYRLVSADEDPCCARRRARGRAYAGGGRSGDGDEVRESERQSDRSDLRRDRAVHPAACARGLHERGGSRRRPGGLSRQGRRRFSTAPPRPSRRSTKAPRCRSATAMSTAWPGDPDRGSSATRRRARS